VDNSSAEPLVFLAVVFGLLTVVGIVLSLLEKPMMRLIGRILPGGNFSARISKDIRIDVGPDAKLSEAEGFSINAEPELPADWKRGEDAQPLSEAERVRYRESWRRTEALFFKKPGEAVREADQLVLDLMRDRGSQSISLQTIETPEGDVFGGLGAVKEAYRFAQNAKKVARGIELAKQHRENEANIVDLKRAMDQYRVIFEKLIGGEEEPKRF